MISNFSTNTRVSLDISWASRSQWIFISCKSLTYFGGNLSSSFLIFLKTASPRARKGGLPTSIWKTRIPRAHLRLTMWKCKESNSRLPVHWGAILLVEQYFWSHSTWGATESASFFIAKYALTLLLLHALWIDIDLLAHAKVCELSVAVHGQHHVFWLDVAMDVALRIKIHYSLSGRIKRVYLADRYIDT